MSSLHESEQIVTLLTSHQQRLMLFIRSLVPHRADAEELLQEVNVFIWRHAEEYTPGTDFAAWAMRIAHFHVLTFRKRQSRERARLSDAVVEQLAERGKAIFGALDLRYDALEKCLERLSAKDRQLITLRYEPAGTTRGVSEQTGRSLKAIYESLQRIRTRLMECVERTLAAEERAR